MKWIVKEGIRVKEEISAEKAVLEFLDSVENTYVELEYDLPFIANENDYVFFPACCYDGNRFDVNKKMYPPLFTPEEASVNMPVTITDVPRLEKDGDGIIEVTTGDVSVPCIGIWSKKEKKAVLFYTIQEVKKINLGLSYKKGKICVSVPKMRIHGMYRWPYMRACQDKGIDFLKHEKVEIPFRIYEFDCENIKAFYHKFFETRKCMGMSMDVPDIKDAKEIFEVLRDKMNKYNWRKRGGFYGTEVLEKGIMSWQPGWIGGGMYTYALMRLGGNLEWERGMSTLHHLFRQQTEAGFFYESCNETGVPTREIFGYDWTTDWHMVRKSADILYYLFMHFDLIVEERKLIPKEFEEGAKKLADAFVRLWKKYKQFGQFVNLITGDIIVGGTSSGVIASAGLARAAVYFNEPQYMKIAEESADYYCRCVEEEGYTVGGPGEILQCPDSESAFALLETTVTLYQIKREKKWLDYSMFLAEFCSSWVVAYNYLFPEGSEFARLNMKTTGCVFANIQNKHAAPGICTFSGYSLYHLYEWTKNEKYLELFRDITNTVHQYMSTEARPIFCWDVPKDATLMQDGQEQRIEREKQPSGFMCERVNMSDWETMRCVGGVFPGSCCWCESVNLLILADRDKYEKR